MIGYENDTSVLHGAHPYTPLALAGAVFCLVFAARSPEHVGALLAVAVLLAVLAGALGQALRAALAIALPTIVLLLVLHGLLGPAPYSFVGPFLISDSGFERAVVLGGRITTVLVATVAVLRSVSPARLVDAMTDRGVPFSVTYLLVSTLTLVPRMRQRAAGILEAQQCRGLRLGGSPFARLAALRPLTLPLILGALMEVDEQVLALDSRGVGRSPRRTALDPPADTEFEWLLRWMCLVVVVAAWTARAREWLL